MTSVKNFRHALLIGAASLAVFACTQGSNITSPGATDAGTPATGGGSDGGSGGGDGATASCPTGFNTLDPIDSTTVCEVSGTINGTLTLAAVDGIAYRLNGRVNVGTDAGVTTGATPTANYGRLIIEPGVTVFGASGADYLVVNRGSEIEAIGSETQPIVFTSEADLEGSQTDTVNATGEWGGVVILGDAPINNCTGSVAPGTAGCVNAVEGVTAPDAIYGGNDTTDSSGTLKYVQVRFAGNELASGNELNGITFAGVGSGTTVDYIQVHNNSDDGVEFFGGNVNVTHLVLTGNDDDSIDTDNGYAGSIQFAAVVQRDEGGDNIVEASSAGGYVSPFSDATIANFTFVSGSTGDNGNAFRLNTGTIGTYINGVVDHNEECFRFEASAGQDATSAYSVANDPSFQSVLFDCAASLDTANSESGTAAAAVAADANNTITTSTLSSVFFPGTAEAGVTAADPNAVNSNLITTDYVGAFSATESATDNWATGWTFGLFGDVSCPTGTTDSGQDFDGKNICRVSGTVNEDTRLTRGNIYELDGRVDVGVDVGADGTATDGDAVVLTIESGVTIFGNSGADYLVVNRGSKLNSNGTQANPVIFTSEADLRDTQIDAENAIGEWGGLVILGRAPINNCPGVTTPGTASCVNAVEGVTAPDGIYGGALSTDSSGSIMYTVVKHAGNEISSGNELNGITFGGVGSGTVVDYIQVHNNSDDGVEFFGGEVNVKHLVLTGNDDDSIDTDNGYNGTIQYAIVVQRDDGGDNIVEASSAGGYVAPFSDAKIANFTFVSGSTGDNGNAFRLNTGTIGKYMNGVVNHNEECFRFEASAGDGNGSYSASADPSFQSVLFNCTASLDTANSETGIAAAAVAADANNSEASTTLSNIFVNGAAENAVTAMDPSTVDADLEATTYIGAVKDADDNWWKGWSCGLEASDPC